VAAKTLRKPPVQGAAPQPSAAAGWGRLTLSDPYPASNLNGPQSRPSDKCQAAEDQVGQRSSVCVIWHLSSPTEAHRCIPDQLFMLVSSHKLFLTKAIVSSAASAELPTMAELMTNGFDAGWPWSSTTIWNAPWRGEIFT
jgi:hypothetical protein